MLSKVRQIIVGRMAKPEEVLIIEDESGHAIKEVLKDGDAMERYTLMHEALVYLTHLDPQDTQHIMQERLQAIMDGSSWSISNLNTLCWAVGSIAESQRTSLLPNTRTLYRPNVF